jgi:transposase
MILPPDLSLLDSAGKDALILALIERLNKLTAQVERLEAEVTALRAENAELRAKLNLPPKNPNNSSIPPSRGQKASEEEKRKPKGKPHAGVSRELHPNPTQVRTFEATHCEHCHADDVTRVVLMGGSCPCCAETFKAKAPVGLEPGSPFGPNLRAFAIYLRTTHAISLERLVRLFSDLFGIKISEGALVNILADSKEAFARQASRIRADLLAGTILASDETSMRVGKRNWWAWVFHHGDACCFLIHPNRSKVAVSEFLGDYRPEIWVSDRFGAQKGWAKRDHQFCLAHLIRDAQYAIDAGDTVFAPLFRDTRASSIPISMRSCAKGPAILRAKNSRSPSRTAGKTCSSS